MYRQENTTLISPENSKFLSGWCYCWAERCNYIWSIYLSVIGVSFSQDRWNSHGTTIFIARTTFPFRQRLVRCVAFCQIKYSYVQECYRKNAILYHTSRSPRSEIVMKNPAFQKGFQKSSRLTGSSKGPRKRRRIGACGCRLKENENEYRRLVSETGNLQVCSRGSQYCKDNVFYPHLFLMILITPWKHPCSGFRSTREAFAQPVQE